MMDGRIKWLAVLLVTVWNVAACGEKVDGCPGGFVRNRMLDGCMWGKTERERCNQPP